MPADIIALDSRIRANGKKGFGRLTLGDGTIALGVHGEVGVKVTQKRYQEDIQALLSFLTDEHGFEYDRDLLELRYEAGLVTHAQLSFRP